MQARMRNLLILAVLSALTGAAQTSGLERARELYLRTDYEQALILLDSLSVKSADAYLLTGMVQYMRGEFKKSSDALEQGVQLAPGSSNVQLWLGRAYGRRAETSSFLTAPGLANRARASFEKAVALDPGNKDAVGDLFDYYLEAPGFLGGGTDKARALAERYKSSEPAEYYYRLARIASKGKDSKTAEEQLRQAMDAAPQQLGRVIDLAKFLARQGRYQESDAAFTQAEEMAPASPRLLFERAKSYIEAKRNLGTARELLGRYLKAPLTPDDPPRSEAEHLLKVAGSS